MMSALRRPHFVWGAFRRTGEAGNTPLALNDEVVARQVSPGAGMAVPGNRAVNEARIEFPYRFVSQVERLHGPGAKVLYQHVGRGHQPSQEVQAVGVLEVQRDTALVAVDAQEVSAFPVEKRGTISAGIVADPRAFYFHHVGAHVG